MSILSQELPGHLKAWQNLDLTKREDVIIALGQGLPIFTRYGKILNADGSVLVLNDAVPLIMQEVEKFLSFSKDIKENL